jgi:hypothetical protein
MVEDRYPLAGHPSRLFMDRRQNFPARFVSKCDTDATAFDNRCFDKGVNNVCKRLYFVLAFLVGCTTLDTGPNASSSDPGSNKAQVEKRDLDKLENIPLVWKPTTALSSLGQVDLTGLDNARLQVDRLTDNRENRGAIGENIEKTPRRVNTPDDVAAFVTDHMKSLISRAGIDTVSSGGTAILKGEVSQFFVDESHIYQGDVRLRLSLESPAGEVLWTGTVRGASVRFGRSYKAQNYYETLSDSLIEATYHLLQDAGFRNALAQSGPMKT